MTEFYADEGTEIAVNDASGSTEIIRPDSKGRIVTDNPLWVAHLERLVPLGLVSTAPRKAAPKAAPKTTRKVT